MSTVSAIFDSGKQDIKDTLASGGNVSDVANALNRKIGVGRSGDRIDLGEEYVRLALAMVDIKGMSAADIAEYKEELRFVDKTSINSISGVAKAEYGKVQDIFKTKIDEYKKAKRRAGTSGMHNQPVYVDQTILDFFTDALDAAYPDGQFVNINLRALNDAGKLTFLQDHIASKNLLSDLMTIYNLDNKLYELAKINMFDEIKQAGLDQRDVDRTWVGADDLIKQYFQTEIIKQGNNKETTFEKEKLIAGDYSPKSMDKDGNRKVPKIKRKDGIIETRIPVSFVNINGVMKLVGPMRDGSGEYMLGQYDDGAEYVKVFDYDTNEEIDYATVRQQYINTVTTSDLIPQISLSSFVKGHILKDKDVSPEDLDTIKVDSTLLSAYNKEFKFVREEDLTAAKAADKDLRAQNKALGAPSSPSLKDSDHVYNINYREIADSVARDQGLSKTPDALLLRADMDVLRDEVSTTRIDLKVMLNKDFGRSQSVSGA